MLLLPLALLVGAAAGLLLGGSLSRLAGLHIRAPGLVLAAAAAQASLPLVPASARFPVVVLSYAMAAAWLAANARHRPPALRLAGALLAVGWLLNTAVIATNGGMPVSLAAVARAGGDASHAGVESTGIRKHVAGTEGRRLTVLGDVIAVPGVAAVSAGDLVLAAGLAVAVSAAMQPGAVGRRRRTVGALT